MSPSQSVTSIKSQNSVNSSLSLPNFDVFSLARSRLFPSLAVLAAADLQKVLNVWQGLGYYSRDRNLQLVIY